jgi:hypothetical protein
MFQINLTNYQFVLIEGFSSAAVGINVTSLDESIADFVFAGYN